MKQKENDTLVSIPDLGASSDISGEIEEVLESLQERLVVRSFERGSAKESKDLRRVLLIDGCNICGFVKERKCF